MNSCVIYITISTFTSVRPSVPSVPSVPSRPSCPVRPVPSHLRVSLRLEFQRPSQTAAERGEAELRILDFKTTWSEFQKASLTTAERGEAELRILDFKTSWSEFQKPSQTATERGEAQVRILDFKTTWSLFQKLVRPLLSEAKPSYVYSILKPHGQSSRSRSDHC